MVLNTRPGTKLAKCEEALWRWNLCCTLSLLAALRSRVNRFARGRAPEVGNTFLFTSTIRKLLLLLIWDDGFSGSVRFGSVSDRNGSEGSGDRFAALGFGMVGGDE